MGITLIDFTLHEYLNLLNLFSLHAVPLGYIHFFELLWSYLIFGLSSSQELRSACLSRKFVPYPDEIAIYWNYQSKSQPELIRWRSGQWWRRRYGQIWRDRLCGPGQWTRPEQCAASDSILISAVKIFIKDGSLSLSGKRVNVLLSDIVFSWWYE